jgi:hypothetical protein
VLPVAGTGHAFALSWYAHARGLKHPRTGAQLPIFGHRYRLYTKPASRKSFNWFAIQFEDQGPLDDADEYRLARELFREVDKERLQIIEQKRLQIAEQKQRDSNP